MAVPHWGQNCKEISTSPESVVSFSFPGWGKRFCPAGPVSSNDPWIFLEITEPVQHYSSQKNYY
jgi:hypothetical protein